MHGRATAQGEIRESTGLTASAGVAPNKFLAKIASGWRKPDGLTVIAPERVEPFLQKLPVDALWGVGPVTAERLRERGIEQLVDVRTRRSRSSARGPSAAWRTGCSSWRGRGRPRRSSRIARRSRRAARTPSRDDLTDLDEIRAEIDEMAARRAGVAGAASSATRAR